MRLQVILFILLNVVIQPAVVFAQRPTIKAGTYNLGSRYITIATQGNRICYQGSSSPSGRYAVAVGETTGSLSSDKDDFVINGWKKYGKTITLRQKGQDLLITQNSNSSEEYSYFPSGSEEKYSDSLTKCLNSTGVFFEARPGYKITQLVTQTNQAWVEFGETNSGETLKLKEASIKFQMMLVDDSLNNEDGHYDNLPKIKVVAFDYSVGGRTRSAYTKSCNGGNVDANPSWKTYTSFIDYWPQYFLVKADSMASQKMLERVCSLSLQNQ